jgi:hypothetical protein
MEERVQPLIENGAADCVHLWWFNSYSAMAGAEKGIPGHTESPEGIQKVWVNSIPVGEIRVNLLVAASFGVPTIKLSGDTAACRELQVLAPQGGMRGGEVWSKPDWRVDARPFRRFHADSREVSARPAAAWGIQALPDP